MYVGIEDLIMWKIMYWSSEYLIIINLKVFKRLWRCTPQGLYESLLLEIDIDQM